MGTAIGQILPLAVGVALSPVPIIAVALMLMSQRARLNGPLFVIGWLIGLAVIGVVVLAVAGPADASSHGKPATWVSVLKLVLGLLLLLVAVRQWHGRPRPGTRSRRRSGWARSSASAREHNAVIMAVICLIIGAKLIGDAIGGFSS
jgi:hypothetical protein